MDMPIQITFRDTSPSPSIEAAIRERAEKLARFHGRMTSCRVAIEAPRRRRHGGLFRVLIQIQLPEGEVVVGRDPAEAHEHEDVYVAIRDAFDAARRILEDRVRRHRGRGEFPTSARHGRVVRLFRDEGYGFILSADGSEIYFHRNSAIGGFDRLEIGSEVHFDLSEDEGEKGPQASRVTLVHGPHHLQP